MTQSSAALRTGLWVGILLGAVTALLYAPVLGYAFVELDDPLYVTANPHLRDGLSLEALRYAFSSEQYLNWHPLTWLSHALDVELFGLEPAGHHAINVALHVLNALLVFGLLRAATGSTLRSGLVAALFALHPLRVESVAWVAERKDVLSACFGLLALRAWVAYARRAGLGRYALVSALYALSLLAKPMLVTFPFLLLLLDFWPLQRAGPAASAGRRSLRFLLLEKLPLLALAAASSALTIVAQHSGRAMEAGAEIPLGARVANALASYVRYLHKSFWPSDLSVLYAHPYLPGGRPWDAWELAGAFALLVAVSAALLWWRRPAPLVGWLWFLGTLVPVIGLVQVGPQGMADRYTYFPSIGLSLALVWLAGDALDALHLRGRRARALAAALAFAVLSALVVATQQQRQHWRDSLALFTHAAQVQPGNPHVYLSRGSVHANAGDAQEALADFTRALERDPRLKQAYNHRGMLYMQLGDSVRARDDFERLLQIDPLAVEAYVNRAQLFRQQGDTERALLDYAAALEIEPLAPAHVGRGQLLQQRGDCAGALAEFEAAVALDGVSGVAHQNVAWVLATCADGSLRDGRRALDHARRACELADQRDFTCLGVLAAAHAEQGDLPAALEVLRTARQGADTPILQDMQRHFESGRPYRVPAP